MIQCWLSSFVRTGDGSKLSPFVSCWIVSELLFLHQ